MNELQILQMLLISGGIAAAAVGARALKLYLRSCLKQL